MLRVGVTDGEYQVRTLDPATQRFVETVVNFDGKAIPVTVSIGLAQVADDPHDTVTSLIARADAALYAAKHGGRNRVVCDEGKVRHFPPRAVS